MKLLKKLIGNWWKPICGDRFYFPFSWVPCNKWHKMVLEPFYSRKECEKRCDELNTIKR